ncbi:unnamed protein product, partial [marine sediment metagenome]
MLKWKHFEFGDILTTKSAYTDMLAGMSGKNRVIKFLAWEYDTDIRIEVYRDAEQIVNFDCGRINADAPPLPMDLPLAEGQLCKIGFYNFTGG